MNKKHAASELTHLSRPQFLDSATGPVTIRMSNDYLFRALLQTDNDALQGLICALLHLEPAQVESMVVANPIELGRYMKGRDFILDVKVLLNSSIVINLELQVINQHNWPERSLSYLCRIFDGLNSGENYDVVKPAVHIGLLDYTLFPERPEFYATYQMLNVKSHALYSDKLRLSVVDLTRTDLATEEDRRYHIDKWAALFRATTWEEIKMIAKNDKGITRAADTVWKLTQEEKIRQQCEAREDYYRCQKDMQLYMKRQADTIAKQSARLEERECQLKKMEEQRVVIMVRQIMNFSRAGHSPQECADMLDIDSSFVDLVYGKIKERPEADAICIADALKKVPS